MTLLAGSRSGGQSSTEYTSYASGKAASATSGYSWRSGWISRWSITCENRLTAGLTPRRKTERLTPCSSDLCDLSKKMVTSHVFW